METTETIQYAGFWRRAGAGLLDGLILSPVILLQVWLSHQFRLFELVEFFFLGAFNIWFNVYLVSRYGGTPGKLMLGVSIRNLDASLVTFRTAVIRYLPELVFWLFIMYTLIYAKLQISPATFAAYERNSFGFLSLEAMEHLGSRETDWISLLSYGWYLSEFVVMLSNKKRRALHDFLASTIVVRVS